MFIDKSYSPPVTGQALKNTQIRVHVTLVFQVSINCSLYLYFYKLFQPHGGNGSLEVHRTTQNRTLLMVLNNIVKKQALKHIALISTPNCNFYNSNSQMSRKPF